MPLQQKTETKGPGRPPKASDAEGVKTSLLQIALHLASEKGAAAVSVRQIAKEAGVTPAMVHYYFGSKHGLFEAVLDDIVATLLPKIRAAIGEDLTGEQTLTEFIGAVTSLMLSEPSIPGFMVKEVILGDGRLRRRFVETYALEIATLIPTRIMQEIEGGNFRRDLDPLFSLLSLAGMTIFPFLARPVAEKGFGVDFGQSFQKKFVDHTSQLFLHGVTPLEEHKS